MQNFLIFFILIFFYSCGQTTPEKVAEAIDIAQSDLSSNDCQAAIDILEHAQRQNNDPIYLQVLSSAYACRANFREIDFIQHDVPLLNSTATGLMKSLSILTKSYESVADSSSVTDMFTALGILLNADGGAQPSQVNRNAKYLTRKAGDMGIEILLQSIFVFGKFLNFYGNVDANGSKGLGPANTDEQGATPSTCFLKYTYAPAVNFLQGAGSPGGICNNMAVNNGHPNLSLAVGNLPDTKRRLCEGLMLLTNVIDTLNNITLSSNSSLGSLASVVTTVNQFKTNAISADPTLATLFGTTSQSACEALLGNPAELNNMQYIYALVFETGLQ